MKRFFATLFVALFLSVGSAEAQTPSWQHQVTFNSGPQFVTGDASDSYKTGLAIDVGYYYRASSNFFVGVAGGLHQFAGEGGAGDLNVIPLNLAFKYNFALTGIQPYIGAEGGPYILSNGSSETKFGVTPRIGLRVPLSRGIDLDLNLKYNVVLQDPDNFTYVGANGGFAYILDRANIQYR
jgi:hypothetical protein